MHARREAGVRCLPLERARQLAATRDRDVQLRVGRRELSQGFEQVGVPLHRIEVAHGHHQPIGVREGELAAQRGPNGGSEPHAVGDRGDPRRPNPEIVAQLGHERLGHGDEAAAHRDCGAEREPAPEPPGVVAAAMHRDEVWNAGPSGGPGAVDGRIELVTVREIDLVVAERGLERARETRRERAIVSEVFHRHARGGELAAEPPFLIRREKGDAGAATTNELARELRQHPLRAPRPVGIDEVGDASPVTGKRVVPGHPACPRRGCSPATQTLNAGLGMVAGTFTRGRAHGSARAPVRP